MCHFLVLLLLCFIMMLEVYFVLLSFQKREWLDKGMQCTCTPYGDGAMLAQNLSSNAVYGMWLKVAKKNLVWVFVHQN